MANDAQLISEAELHDSEEQQQKFAELGQSLDADHLQPSERDFERTATINQQARLEERWDAEQAEINREQLLHPDPNDIILKRAALAQSGMDLDQIDRQVHAEIATIKRRHEHAVAELSDKELVRALEIAARTGGKVDLDAVKRELNPYYLQRTTTMADSPRDEMNRYDRQRAQNAGLTELFRQHDQKQTQTQTEGQAPQERETQAQRQVHRQRLG